MTVEQVAAQLAAWVQSVAHQKGLPVADQRSPAFAGHVHRAVASHAAKCTFALSLARSFNIDMVHFGVVMTANLSIALYTPPVGGTLFVAAKLADAGSAPSRGT